MIRTGLVSVTFRKLAPKEIVALVSKAGLEAIEWGGDVHVPHGDVKRAKEVLKTTKDAGLKIASYGSYYYAGHEKETPFGDVLDTAIALTAPTIRVWAGKIGSNESDESYRKNVVKESQRIADMAKSAGIVVAYEFHKDTLTDTMNSTVNLLKEVFRDNVMTYWQPLRVTLFDYYIKGLKDILPWLNNIHVYQIDKNGNRQPLSSGRDLWKKYLDMVKNSGKDHFALLEFVKSDEPQQFIEDAKTLKTSTTQGG